MDDLTVTQERVKMFLEGKKYSSIKNLGQGAFGEVLSAVSPKKEKVAIKIIPNEFSWHLEENWWPTLSHPFILPLLECMDAEEMDCKLYVMPFHPDCLHEMVQCLPFRNDCCAVIRLKRWFLETISALQYLHYREMCHLDVTADNVLISQKDSAILCDFSGINFAGVPLKRFCSPKEFRPPEYFYGGKTKGTTYDMWTYGLMVLNALTNHGFSRCMRPVAAEWSWDRDIKGILERILEASMFTDLMAAAMPGAQLSRDDCELALKFVKGLLRYPSQARLTAVEASNHRFLDATKSVKDHYHENFSKQVKSTGEKIFCVAAKENVESTIEKLVSKKNETPTVVDGIKDKDKKHKAPRSNKGKRMIDDYGNLNAVGVATMVDICSKDDSLKSKLLHPTDAKKLKPDTKIGTPVKIKMWFAKKMHNVFKRKNKYEILESNFDDEDN